MIFLELLSVLLLDIIAPGYPAGNDILPSGQDTIRDPQVLYNGRIWRNLYAKVDGTQFLFTSDLLQGTVSIGGTSFREVPLKYDVYTDELMAETNRGLTIQLNKEMVDSFSLSYMDREYFFVRIDSGSVYDGYVNIQYKGRSKFIVKYRKNIALLALDKKFDQFYPVNKLYLVRDGRIDEFSGRLEFFRLLGDHKKAVRTFMNKNKAFPSKEHPQSFVPLIEYYDKIR